MVQTDFPDYFKIRDIPNAEHTHFFKDGACTECFNLLGDLNHDNAVTTKDSFLLAGYLQNPDGLLLNLSVADMNHDGVSMPKTEHCFRNISAVMMLI